jgi:phenylacetate-CoA ligase
MSWHATTYFAIARAREGLTRAMIDRHRELFDSSRSVVEGYVEARLETLARRRLVRADRRQAWPPATKDALRTTLDALPRARGQHWRRTSGSSGKPFAFPRSREMLAHMDAVMWAAYGWHGIGPGQRHLYLWGRPFAGKARWLKWMADRAMSRERLNAFSVTPERIREYVVRARRWRPQWVYGYPNLTAFMVDACEAQGLDLGELAIRTVVLTGEMLHAGTRRRIGEAFRSRVVNEYGCTEGGVLALECESGSAHTLPGAALLETLDDDHHPVTNSPGQVAITDLHESPVTFDRLLIGDRAAVDVVAQCPCGRRLPTVTGISGRTDGWIRLPSGRRVYDAVIAYAIPAAVRQFQARQLAADRLHVVVIAPDLTGANEQAFITDLTRELGGEVTVTVERASELPAEPNGKLRYFIPLTADS